MAKVKFNLNNHIYVKLTNEGFWFWKGWCDSMYEGKPELINPIGYYTSKADKDGFVKFQAHEFMKIFGTTDFFDFNILIDIDLDLY